MERETKERRVGVMERISIQEIAAVLVNKSGLKKKDAERFATTMFEVVKDGLASDRLVKIKGLGTFKVIDIEARESVNVNTGERVLIEGHGKITFTSDATMKELVNKPFSQFETVILNEGVVFDDMSDELGETVVAEELEEPAPPMMEEEATTKSGFTEKEEEIKPELPQPEEPKQEVVQEPIEEVQTEPSEEVQTEPAEEIQAKPEKEMEPEPEEEIETEPDIHTLTDIQTETENIQTEITNEDTMKPISRHNYKKVFRSKVRIWALITLLMCIASFGAGYFIGLNKGKSMAFDSYAKQPIEIVDAKKNDTAVVEATTKEKAPVSKEKETPVVKEEKAAPAKTAEPESIDPDKYSAMDGRVRTGAYRIIGTDYEEKVKAGETVAHFSQRTLGPGMSCYIEVYNGIKASTVLKEGQTLKVPKLEMKIKKKQLKKKQTVEQTN